MSSDTANVSFPEAIKTAIESFLEDVNICLPGRITEVNDFKRRKVSVVSDLKRVFNDGDTLDPPIITNVTLQYSGSDDAILKFPIKVGQKVLLIFSQRSLDNWLQKGALTTPGSNRMFDLSDCFAIPCLQTFESDHSLIENNEDTELIYNGKKIKLIKNGALQIDTSTNKVIINNAVEDFAKLMSDFISDLISLKTIGSPSNHTLDPTTIAALQALQVRFSNLLEES